MTSTELKSRTKNYAHRCIKLSMALPKTILGNYIAGQLIRSSLSVAANYRAACLAQSKKEFASKISIVLEEADESLFWIEMVGDEKVLETEKLLPIKQESEELTKIFAASRITVRSKEKSKPNPKSKPILNKPIPN